MDRGERGRDVFFGPRWNYGPVLGVSELIGAPLD